MSGLFLQGMGVIILVLAGCLVIDKTVSNIVNKTTKTLNIEFFVGAVGIVFIYLDKMNL